MSKISTSQWPTPRDLTAGVPPEPEFPIAVLGKVLEPATRDIARIVQAPTPVVAQALLAATTLACQVVANVKTDGRLIPINNFFLTIAPSGERKSTIDDIALRPIRSMTGDGNEGAKAMNADDVECLGLTGMVLWQDATYDGLEDAIRKGGRSVGVFCDDGGTFIGGYAMSGREIMRTTASLSKLWDGELPGKARMHRQNGNNRHCRLSMHLMLQPSVAAELVGNEALRRQGFLARYLTVFTPGLAGRREYQQENVYEAPSVRAYWKRLRRLLKIGLRRSLGADATFKPKSLELTSPAKAELIRFFGQVEARMGVGKPLAGYKEIASRASEQVQRLAAVLTLVLNPAATKVKSREVRSAIRLVRHYLKNVQLIDVAASGENRLQCAKLTLSWLRDHRKRFVKLQTVYQFGPPQVRLAKDARAVMRELVRLGWARKVSAPGSEKYELHPLVLKGYSRQ